MARAIRDVALFQNNLIAAVKAAGTAGIPLRDALKSVAGREPLGCDYAAANNLRKAGVLEAIKNLPKGAFTVYYKNGAAAPEAVAPAKRIKRRRKVKPDAGILLTIQYGRGESVTLSFDEARQIYGQLAAMFTD